MSTTFRVLVVEDHALTRAGLQLVFKGVPDIEIVGEAINGKQAVELARELAPDVVLMDIGLPLLDGIAATKEIKQECPRTRVLMLTSHSEDADLFSAFASGADGYCLKDIARELLESAVRCVGSGAAWLDPAIAGRVLAASTVARRLPAGNHASAQERKNPALDLTEREHDVLSLLVEGMSNQQIAKELTVSPETVKSHVSHILEKLNVSDRTQAAVKALRAGLV
jgi:DNA-binding NarL/FixJ family response regulator